MICHPRPCQRGDRPPRCGGAANPIAGAAESAAPLHVVLQLSVRAMRAHVDVGEMLQVIYGSHAGHRGSHDRRRQRSREQRFGREATAWSTMRSHSLAAMSRA